MKISYDNSFEEFNDIVKLMRYIKGRCKCSHARLKCREILKGRTVYRRGCITLYRGRIYSWGSFVSSHSHRILISIHVSSPPWILIPQMCSIDTPESYHLCVYGASGGQLLSITSLFLITHYATTVEVIYFPDGSFLVLYETSYAP